jgi:lipid A 3-O-deacylase
MYFGRYDVSLRVQHLSNGGLRDPNPGINFVLVRLQYSLE